MPSLLSKTDLANQALSHLAAGGTSVQIQDFDTDRDAPAQACRLFFDSTRDEVLRAAPWNFATAIAALALVSQNAAPYAPEWPYSYQLPADCLAPRRFQNGAGIRRETRLSRVRWRRMGDLLLTDQPSPAYLEYTARITDTTRFDPDFAAAFSYLLAVKIAPRVTGGDPQKLGPRAYQLYAEAIDQARVANANEDAVDEAPASEFESAREGYVDPWGDSR
jgi:hypothetical protein